MKRAALTHIAAAFVLLLWGGCAVDTPTQAAGDADDAVAALVAGAVGYESNGFAAMLSDAVAVAAGETVASDSAVGTMRLISSTEGSEPARNMNVLLVVRHGNEKTVASQWRMTYGPITTSTRGEIAQLVGDTDKNSVKIEAGCDGVFRNARQTMEGESSGTFSIDRTGDATRLAGRYEYNGSASFHNGTDEQYSAVRITFNWNRLLVASGVRGGYRPSIGQVDVSISANGPQGTISKNARLVFDGTDHARLSIGGRTFVVDVEAAALTAGT